MAGNHSQDYTNLPPKRSLFTTDCNQTKVSHWLLVLEYEISVLQMARLACTAVAEREPLKNLQQWNKQITERRAI